MYKKTEQYDEKAMAGLMESYRQVLGHLGENPDREGLLKTPERLAKAMQYLPRVITWMRKRSSIRPSFTSPSAR